MKFVIAKIMENVTVAFLAEIYLAGSIMVIIQWVPEILLQLESKRNIKVENLKTAICCFQYLV